MPVVKTIYRAAPHAGFGDKEASILGRRLMKISKRNGGLIPPEVVVEEGWDESSPFYRHLNWDNDKAAHEHRLEQARHLIRHVKIITVAADGEQREIRPFIHVKVYTEAGEPATGYSTLDAILASPELKRQVLAKALRELNGWKERYAQFEEFFRVTKEIDKLRKKLADE